MTSTLLVWIGHVLDTLLSIFQEVVLPSGHISFLAVRFCGKVKENTNKTTNEERNHDVHTCYDGPCA